MTQKYNAGMGRAAKQYMDLRTGTQDEPMGRRPTKGNGAWQRAAGQSSGGDR